MSSAQRKKEALNNKIGASIVNQRIKSAFYEGQKVGIHETINMMLWILHTKEGFGKQRLTRVYKALCDLADCANADKLTLEDVRQALADECQIIVGDVK